MLMIALHVSVWHGRSIPFQLYQCIYCTVCVGVSEDEKEKIPIVITNTQ